MHIHSTTSSVKPRSKVPQEKFSSFTTAAGPVQRRTAPMSRGRAEAFAKCLAANGRFAGAPTVHETKAGSGRWFVAFLPASEESQQAILATCQQEQIDRAIAEMDGYDYEEPMPGTVLVTTTAHNNLGTLLSEMEEDYGLPR
jgi:hypothetical protein